MEKLAKLFVPTRIELVVYGISSIVIFIIFSFSSFLDTIVGNDFGEQVGKIWSGAIDSFLDEISQFQLSAQASLIIFWVIFAVILYVVVNVAHNLWVEARNDIVVEEQFVHPMHYSHDNFWVLLVQRSAFRLAMVIILIVYTYAVFNLLLPLWLNFFHLWINNLTSITDWFFLIVAFAGMGVTMHLYVVFVRLFLMRVRVLEQS